MTRGSPLGAPPSLLLAFAALLLPACDVSSTVGFNAAALAATSCAERSPISACDAGSCVVTELGRAQVGSWAVAADDELVFFQRTPTVLSSVPIGGGPVTDVRTDLDRIWTIAVDEEYVYTTEFGIGVRRVKKSGGESELVMHPKGTFTVMALGRDHVYVALTSENQIAMVPKAGG